MESRRRRQRVPERKENRPKGTRRAPVPQVGARQPVQSSGESGFQESEHGATHFHTLWPANPRLYGCGAERICPQPFAERSCRLTTVDSSCMHTQTFSRNRMQTQSTSCCSISLSLLGTREALGISQPSVVSCNKFFRQPSRWGRRLTATGVGERSWALLVRAVPAARTVLPTIESVRT